MADPDCFVSYQSDVFYRLRRNVTLFKYPEISVSGQSFLVTNVINK